MLWTNEYLNDLALEAEIAITNETPCIIDRLSLQVMEGVSEYQLPDYVDNIRRVFYKGFRLDPLPSMGFDWFDRSEDGAFAPHAFTDAFFIRGGGATSTTGANRGRPWNYYYSTFGENVIRFDPGINEDVAQYPDGLYDINIANAVIVEFYRIANGADFKVPPYVRKRTIKAYVMWKAFEREGDGQNLQASAYWQKRYAILTSKCTAILNNVYRAAIPARDAIAGRYLTTPARPVLPPNYGIVCEYDDW